MDHIARVYEPVVYCAETENKTRTIIAHISYIPPDLVKIGDEHIQTAMAKLNAIAVINMCRSAKKPISEPLISYVCAKSIVSWRR